MLTVLSITLPFFALVGCGWLARRFSVLGPESGGALTGFVFSFALPALLFRSAATRDLAAAFDLQFVVLYTLAGLAAVALAVPLARLLFGADLQAQGIHAICAVVGNLGFMGLPLISGLLGEETMLPMMLALTIDVLVMIPVALVFLELGRAKLDSSLLHRVWSTARGLMLNPFLIAIFAGVVWSVAGLPLPRIADNFLALLGGAAGPCALFALGITLYGRPLAEGLGESLFMALVKLGLHPLLMALVMLLIYDGPQLWAHTAILIAALPIAGNAYVFASKYGVRVARASTGVLFSTIIAVVTVSALAAVW